MGIDEERAGGLWVCGGGCGGEGDSDHVAFEGGWEILNLMEVVVTGCFDGCDDHYPCF
jgi:hypothetical protein